MPTADLSKKPVGFRMLSEGEHTLKIIKVTGTPRTKVTNVEIEFIDAEGIKLKNGYNLTIDGGYAAFHYLVTACGFEVGPEFDIDNLLGCFVEVEIVHREGTKPNAQGVLPVFANIAKAIGIGTPFGEDGDDTPADEADASEEWED